MLRSVAFFIAVLLASPLTAEPVVLSVSSAEAAVDEANGLPAVWILLDEDAAADFEALTGANVGLTMVFRIDGEAVMSPVIRTAIKGGSLLIAGDMTEDEAGAIAARIASGEAAVEVEVIAPYEGLPRLPPPPDPQ